MAITPASFLYFFVVISILIRNKDVFMCLLLLCVTSDLFIGMGFFVMIGKTIITHYDFCLYILFLYCLTKCLRKPIKLNRTYCILHFLYLLPLFLLIIFPSKALVADAYRVTWDEIVFDGLSPVHPAITNGVLKFTLKFLISSFIVLYLYNNFSKEKCMQFIIYLSKIINYFLFLGIIECIVKNLFGNIELWGNITEFFFGSTPSTVYEARLRGGTYELNLFSKEASHYAYTLFLSMIILFARNIFIGNKSGVNFSLLLCVALMILSTSFSVVLFLASFFVLFLLYRWGVLRPSTQKYEKLVLIAVSVFGFSGFMSFIIANDDGFVFGRLSNFIENWQVFFDINNTVTFGDGSTYVRIMSILQTFAAFLDRPFFGFSIGSVFCHGSTAMLFAGIGLIGVIFWTKFYFYTFYLSKRLFYHKRLYLAAIIVYFGVNTFNSLSLRPFYDMTLITIVICYYFILSSHLVVSNAKEIG